MGFYVYVHAHVYVFHLQNLPDDCLCVRFSADGWEAGQQTGNKYMYVEKTRPRSPILHPLERRSCVRDAVTRALPRETRLTMTTAATPSDVVPDAPGFILGTCEH